MKIARSVCLSLCLSLCPFSWGIGADSFELNPHTHSYDHHPSVSIGEDGSMWVALHTYLEGKDSISIRCFDQRGKTLSETAFNDPEVTHSPPTIVAHTASRAAIFWSAKVDQRWHVFVRHWRNGMWSERTRLSDINTDAIFPTAILTSQNRFLIAWAERVGKTFQIRGCTLHGSKMSDLVTFSGNNSSAYRPVLVEHDSEVWGFWDEYQKPNYSIKGRRLLPASGPIENVSPRGEYCLTPTVFSHPTGLHVAWLRKEDVMGGPGVISQWHSLHASVRQQEQWKQILTTSGESEAADLTQGLMAKIDPKPVATGGYLGSRAKPILGEINGQVHLFWERKSDHRGSTPKVPGDLLARPISNLKWQTPVQLHRGFVDYHILHPHSHTENKASLSVIASDLPRQGRRIYKRAEIPIADAKPFKQDEWTGWKPIELPVKQELLPRREITHNGKKYKLYWGDFHCHSNLSADAEGETDELNYYARDRAGLDVVVFTNNDFYNVPLTQYEFELGNLFANTYSEKGTFLSLPGYEWTSRIPGVSTAKLSDSGNWLPPYRNRSYANHRSVIYPAAGGPLVHFTEVGNDINKLNAAVQRAGGITLSQHPMFELSGHPVEVGLELTSGWSNYILQVPKLFHDSLDQGLLDKNRRLGFVACGDSHRRAPGLSGALTGIYAESLSAESILDAVRNRRCFATSGAQMFVSSTADDGFMGEETKTNSNPVNLKLHAIGTRPILSAVLIRNGNEIYRSTGNGKIEFQVDYTDSNLEKGNYWYYWRISQDKKAPTRLAGNLATAHGHLAWSSPHWVVVE